jgi:hypothetical protein
MQFNDLPPECIAVGICPYLNFRMKMSGQLKRIKSSDDLTIASVCLNRPKGVACRHMPSTVTGGSGIRKITQVILE